MITVVRLDRPTFDRDELGDRRAERIEPAARALGYFGVDRAHPSVVQSATSGFSCTGNVALNSQSASSAAGSSNSNSGCAIGRTRVLAAAFQNQPPMWLSIASVIRRSLPTFWTSTCLGTLPFRKPGIFALRARSVAACSTA